VPGRGRGFNAMDRMIGMVKTALDAGATVRTDNKTNAERTHNAEGEGALRLALIDGGYFETVGDMYSTWTKRSHIKRNAENVESDQGEGYEANDRGDKQGSPGHGFVRRVRQHSEDFVEELRKEGVGSNPDANASSLVAVGDFGDTKKYIAFVNKSSEGSIYSTVVSPEIFPILQKVVDRILANGADENDLLKAIEDHALQQAYYDPADGSVGTIGPIFGTPAFEFHGERGHLLDTGKYWFGEEGTPEGRIYQVKNTTRDQISRLFGTVMAFHEATGEEGAAPKWTRESGARPGKEGSIKRSAETLTGENDPTVEPSVEQHAKQAKMGSANPPNNLQVTSALAHFKRTLSDQVKVIFAESFPDMKFGADYNTLEHLARISTANPLKIMQLAYHESMHGFFDTVLNAKGHEKIKAMMQDAMSEPKLYARLKDMLKDSPQALADMERDPEERVAYAYQFWAAGMLDIAKKPQGFFEHVQQLMRRVFGAVAANEKALAMFEAFHKGELKEPSAAGAAILKIMNTGEWKAQFLKRFDRQAQAVYAEVMANHLVGRNSESATARKLNNIFYSNPAYAEDTAEEGMINRTQMQRKKFINRLRLALRPLSGVNATRDLEALGKALNSHTTPELAHVAKAKVAVQALLKQYHEYAREAGLDIGERLGTDGDADYFTRVLDMEKLIDGKEAFVSMLMTNYPHVLKPAIALLKRTSPAGSTVSEIDVANNIYQTYIDNNGVDDNKLSAMREDGILNPFFAAQNKRELYWIKDADIAPFLNNDAVGTLTQYISQGVRAAEYTRAFGKGGIELKDAMAREGDVQMVDKDGEAVLYTEDGPVAKELKEAAEKAGLKGKKAEEWVDRRIDDLRRSHGAYEGSLGKDISARTRNLQAGAMIYQTLRLLPLMIFSSMMDPNGIRVAGGTSDDMWNAYKRGFAGLWNNYKDLFLGNPFGSRDPDAKEMAALEAGVIDSDMELEEMGQVHSSEYSSGMTRHISHAFFKSIGITQWDRDMRISATDAARKAIVSHSKTSGSRMVRFIPTQTAS
jgi:hypothetical protein